MGHSLTPAPMSLGFLINKKLMGVRTRAHMRIAGHWLGYGVSMDDARVVREIHTGMRH